MHDNQEILDGCPKEKDILTTPASRVGAFISNASFTLGTILFLYFVIPRDPIALQVGLIFVITAFCINSIYVYYLFYLVFLPGINEGDSINRKTAIRMLINIPIAIIYIFVIMKIPSPLSF